MRGMVMNTLYRTVTIATSIFLTLSASAQVSEAPDPLFQDDETLQVTITAPLTTLVRERPKDDYLPGVFQYTETDGTAVKFDLQIRTRGHFRHKTCDYPPLRLNLILFDLNNLLSRPWSISRYLDSSLK